MTDSCDQKRAFMDGEGDAYHLRNLSRKPNDDEDPIVQVIQRLRLGGIALLEIGCGSSERLAKLQNKMAIECCGIDPSKAAIGSARKRYPHLALEIGTADALPFANDRFDVVIFGFCLYLTDPADFFSVAREADRVLKNLGTLLIWDFCTPIPYRNEYRHRAGILTRKMEWSRMFTWNPAYNLVHREWTAVGDATVHDVDARATVDVLVKDISRAFPPPLKFVR